MTKKPISSISFNTAEFLRLRCCDLVSKGKIQSYLFIRHYAEKDTKKDHHHLLLIPCAPVDPQVVRRSFVEPSFNPGEGDLGCLPFQTSKIGDWLLYSLHFPPYLLKKGLFRINHYNLRDIETNEPFDYLEYLFNEASEGLVDTRIDLFLSRMKDGVSFGDLLALGYVPPNQIVFYEKLYRTNSRHFGINLDDVGNLQLQEPKEPLL